jgi:hypothetical protein
MIHFLHNESIKIAIIILTFAVLGYTTFLLYQDSISIKEELSKIKKELNGITEQIENAENLFEQEGHIQSDSEPEYPESDLDDTEQYELEDSEIESSIDEPLHQKAIESYEIETEKTPIIEEVSDNDTSNSENEESPVFLFKKTDTDDQNKTKQKCCFILKGGKRIGETCLLKAINDTEFCKNHTSKK